METLPASPRDRERERRMGLAAIRGARLDAVSTHLVLAHQPRSRPHRRHDDRSARCRSTLARSPHARYTLAEPVRAAPRTSPTQLLVRQAPRSVNAVSTRFFAALADGASRRTAKFEATGGTAQIEDVNTLGAYRGRGLGRAVVQHALDEARPRTRSCSSRRSPTTGQGSSTRSSASTWSTERHLFPRSRIRSPGYGCARRGSNCARRPSRNFGARRRWPRRASTTPECMPFAARLDRLRSTRRASSAGIERARGWRPERLAARARRVPRRPPDRVEALARRGLRHERRRVDDRLVARPPRGRVAASAPRCGRPCLTARSSPASAAELDGRGRSSGNARVARRLAQARLRRGRCGPSSARAEAVRAAATSCCRRAGGPLADPGDDRGPRAARAASSARAPWTASRRGVSSRGQAIRRACHGDAAAPPAARGSSFVRPPSCASSPRPSSKTTSARSHGRPPTCGALPRVFVGVPRDARVRARRGRSPRSSGARRRQPSAQAVPAIGLCAA